MVSSPDVKRQLPSEAVANPQLIPNQFFFTLFENLFYPDYSSPKLAESQAKKLQQREAQVDKAARTWLAQVEAYLKENEYPNGVELSDFKASRLLSHKDRQAQSLEDLTYVLAEALARLSKNGYWAEGLRYHLFTNGKYLSDTSFLNDGLTTLGLFKANEGQSEFIQPTRVDATRIKPEVLMRSIQLLAQKLGSAPAENVAYLKLIAFPDAPVTEKFSPSYRLGIKMVDPDGAFTIRAEADESNAEQSRASEYLLAARQLIDQIKLNFAPTREGVSPVMYLEEATQLLSLTGPQLDSVIDDIKVAGRFKELPVASSDLTVGKNLHALPTRVLTDPDERFKIVFNPGAEGNRYQPQIYLSPILMMELLNDFDAKLIRDFDEAIDGWLAAPTTDELTLEMLMASVNSKRPEHQRPHPERARQAFRTFLIELEKTANIHFAGEIEELISALKSKEVVLEKGEFRSPDIAYKGQTVQIWIKLNQDSDSQPRRFRLRKARGNIPSSNQAGS